MSKSIEATGIYKKTVYKGANDFSIVVFEPTKDSVGKMEVHEDFGTFTVKGTFPHLKEGEEYKIHATEESHYKHGISYNLQFIKSNRKINFENKESLQAFLETIVSQRIAKNIVDTLENPQEVLENGNAEELIKVKGVGQASASKIFKAFDENKDYSKAYIELGKHGIDNKSISKIIQHFKSVDKAIDMVLNNPYAMTEINGYGFKRCDEIFLKVHPNQQGAVVRVRAFIHHTLSDEVFQAGNTWFYLDELIDKVGGNLGLDKYKVAKVLGEMIKDPTTNVALTHKDERPRIANKRFFLTESKVAENLLRIKNDKFVFRNESLDKIVAHEEQSQGWNFTEQQKDAIKAISDNKVIILEGLAGSGKSTSLKVLLDFYSSLNYSFAQTALSGKASSNLTLITGREGKTIHRLLGINHKEGGFMFNDRNKLPYDIIIVDEISMVDVMIFNHLILAMKDSAKLILVGDSEQLEAIGVPVMKPLIESGVIKRVMLTEIHRQAKKSAVVTHSIQIRKGFIPSDVMDNPNNVNTYGELQDLTYNLVDSENDITFEVASAFNEKLKDGASVTDIQIISPMRSRGDSSCEKINRICQKIYNGDETKASVVVKAGFEGEYILREGDKVINVRNNYNSVDVDGDSQPIFNGSLGIINEFKKWYSEEESKYIDVMIVHFEGVGQVVIKPEEYTDIELAYCITIHKSQGMGVKHVIVAYPFAYTLISRQSLYTAITRAKATCTLITEYKTLKYAVKRDATKKKRVYLPELLKETNVMLYSSTI